MLDKVGDQLDRSCERCSITQSWRRGTSYKTKQRNANWIGHILSTNYLLQHVVQRKIEETVRRGTRIKHLLDDLKERRREWNLKDDALDSTVGRTRFGRGYGPVTRRTTWRYLLRFSCRSTGRQYDVDTLELWFVHALCRSGWETLDSFFKATTLNNKGLQASTTTVDQLAFFCVSMSCGRYVFRRFRGTYCLQLQSDNLVHVDDKVVGNVSVIWEDWRKSGP